MGGYAPDTQDPADDWLDPSDQDIERAATRIAAGSWRDPGGALIHDMRFVDLPNDLSDPVLSFLLEYWSGLSEAGGSAPLRDRIDVLEMRPAIGMILLLDVERDGFDARYRVYGTRVAAHGGRDWTGQTVSEMNAATRTPMSLMYRACYRCVYLTGRPTYTEHDSPLRLAVQGWRRLVLPLFDAEARCSAFLVGTVPVPARKLPPEAAQTGTEARLYVARRGRFSTLTVSPR